MRWSASVPALLLPVRLETRFGEGAAGPELWVRIYPDQISIDSHEPRLSDSEVTAGTIHWETIWYAGTGSAGQAKEKAAWQALATAYGPRRAAWIAAALKPRRFDEDRPQNPLPLGSSPKPDIRPPDPQARRASSWERAPLAAALPDYWVVAAYADGEEKHKVTSNPVRRPLAVGPDPQLSVNADPRDLQTDAGMLWMVDFEEAIDAGMAVRIQIDSAERERGFDRIAAVGLRSSVQADGGLAAAALPDRDDGTGTPLLKALLDAHHYTDGLAFAPQGSRTNNTSSGSSDYSRQDPGYERSFAIERSDPLDVVDGQAAAFAFGLPESTFEHTEYADRTDQVNARAMGLALWPATLGYFLRQLMADEFTVEEEQVAKRWFMANVCPRGPVPAFRVGATPYGVLPITSLAALDPEEPTEFESGLITFLRRMLPLWRQSAEGVPRVKRDPGGDPDGDLVELLGMDASAQSFRGRHVLGDECLDALDRLLQIGDQWERTKAIGRALLDKYGYTTLEPRLVNFGFYEKSFELSYPAIQEEPLSETEPLATVDMAGTPVNYISWLRRAKIDDIRHERYPGGKAPTALLYKVLRAAVLSEYANLAFEAQIEIGNLDPEDMREPELVGFPGRGPTVTAWTALSSEAPGITASGQSLASYLEAAPDTPPLSFDLAHRAEPPFLTRLRQLRWSLEWLAKLPTAELQRLFTETLDTCSHRLDAWITGLAFERLRHFRQNGGAVRLHVGAFGVVEDLRPAPRPPAVTGAAATVVAQVDQERAARVPNLPQPRQAREAGERNGGFIHAPSLDQASAAAVLRNGYLTHRERTDGKLLAVDLSSGRVRVALSLLEGVRQGQSLGALLGYRFESALYGRGLGAYVQAFRARYPVVANKLTPSNEPAEAVAATNVVDGEALYRDWIGGAFSWGGGLPPAGTDRDKAIAALEELRDAADALGDLSISESVYQLIRGNYVRAGGLLDAISRGERPPEADVAQLPRGGIDLTHRLMLLMMATPARSPNWPAATPARPRAQAEPRLDAWLSNLLPRPDKVQGRVAYTDAAGAEKELSVRLSDLDLDPLDCLTLTDAADQPQSSELEQRILYHALQTVPSGSKNLRLVFGRKQGWQADELSFPEWLVLARALRELVAGARAVRPEDLIEPERTFDQKKTLEDGNDLLETRADNATKALRDGHKALDDAIAAVNPASASTVDDLRDRLFDASFFGVAGAIPALGTTTDPAALANLRQQAEAASAELKRRKDAAGELDKVDRSKLTPAQLRDHLVALIQTVFGPAFSVLPQFRPPDGDALANAFGQSTALVSADPSAPERWLDQVAHVRAGSGRYQAVRTMADLVGPPRPPLTLAQLPYRQNDRWLGLPLAPGAPPPGGRVAIAAELTGNYSKTALHGGLLIDSWAERIPSAVQATGVSFHFDQPTSRAPQSLLLAVCPDDREDWSDDLLLSLVGEAMELAKIRMVDLDSLAEVGQIAPALYFPFNADNQTVTGIAVFIN